MPLPQTKYPVFEVPLPSSTSKIIRYRQMLVSDEKILLMAKSSEDEVDINRAVKQVVNNCIFNCNIDTFTTFDIEFLFLKIRSVSIGNEVELGFLDKEDEQEYDITVNLDDVKVQYPEAYTDEGHGTLFTTGDPNDGGLGIVMKWPPASLFDEPIAAERGDYAYEFIVARCIEKIFEGDEIHLASEYNDDELLEFVKNLDTKTYNNIKKFISNTPTLYYEIKYTNSKGTERKIALKTLTDFFTLR